MPFLTPNWRDCSRKCGSEIGRASGADAAGPPPKVAKSRGTKQPQKVACRFGQTCITKDAADEKQRCKYIHHVAPAKVQTWSLIIKSFYNIMNIDKTQQKSVNLDNFPVNSRISLANKSEMCSPSGHKEEVTRSSVRLRHHLILKVKLQCYLMSKTLNRKQ